MKPEIYKKYDFFDDLIVQIYDIDERILKEDALVENSRLHINLLSTSKFLDGRWPQLLKESQDYSIIQKNYLEEVLPWKEKYNAFKDITEPSQLSEFIKKFYAPWTRLRFESREIEMAELEDILMRLQPKIRRYFNDSYWGYKNFLVFEDHEFRIILHLALKAHKTETFSLEIIFSFWSDKLESETPFGLEDIQLKYRNSMIAYEILNKLNSFGYIIDTLKYQEKREGLFGSAKKREFKNWPTACAIIEILNINPLPIIEELKTHLYQIDQTINEIMSSKDFSPRIYFEELPKKIKDFLIEGREFLTKIKDILAIDSPFVKNEVIKPKKSSRSDDKLVELLGIFRDILEKDKADNLVVLEDKGYRTLNEIIPLYKNKLKFSPPTYYKYMKENDLSLYFENRKKEGSGGGDQYRYRDHRLELQPDALEVEDKITPDDNIEHLHEKLKIQEAFRNYNTQNFQESINIFEKLLKKPSDDFKANSELFIACLYYMGRAYFKIMNYSKALQYFDRIKVFNRNIISANYYRVECNRYLGNNHQAVEEITKVISEIREYFDLYHSELDLDVIFGDWYREYQLKNLHPNILTRDMFSERFVFYNKSINKIKIDIYPDERYEIQIKEVNFKKNMIATRSIFKILLRAILLKMELLRRKVFNGVIEGKEELINEEIGILLDFIKSMKKIRSLEKYYPIPYASYMRYFIELLKTFNFQKIAEIIRQKFPVKTSGITMGVRGALKTFNPVFAFLSRINLIFNRFNQNPRILHTEVWKDRIGDLSDSEPILKAEFLFIQAFLNHKYVVNSIIKNESYKTILNKEDLFKFHGFYPYGGKARYHIEVSERTYKYCKENNIKLLVKRSLEILKVARVKYREITNLINQRRALTMNHYFKEYSETFQVKTLKIKLDYTTTPNDNISWFVIDTLLSKISDNLSEKHEKIQIEILLFSSEVFDELIMEIKKNKNFIRYKPFLEFYYGVKLSFDKFPHENKLNMEVDIYLNLKKDFKFEEKLDSITEVVFLMLESNRDELTIKFNLEEKPRLDHYFKEQFPIFFHNNYFSIEKVNTSSKNKVLLKIRKKDNQK